MFQKVIIVGRLGRDPEMRYFPDGTPVTNFSVAVNREYDNREGERVNEVGWFRVTTRGKLAENCQAYLVKGALVLVEGRLLVDPGTGGPRIYSRRDGTVGASFEVLATAVRFLTSKAEREALEQEDDGVVQAVDEMGGMEDELPF